MAQSSMVFKEDFENLSVEQRAKGIQGGAFNLSLSAEKRNVLKYKIDKSKWKESFTLSAWVFAEEDFEAYNIIDLAVNYSDSSIVNWRINKQVNHTWAWELAKKDFLIDYKPGNTRQLITKTWSLITLSFNSEKEEIAMYYNDKQVAIYSLEGMIPNKPIDSISMRIGGEEKGDLGEWESFNGMVDEVLIYNYAFSSQEVKEYYDKFRSSDKAVAKLETVDTLRVLTYNIWHGGNETGKEVGFKRIAEIIRNSKADVVTMQETYGSGAKIADELGFYFYLRSSNISVMSKYPIKETLKSYNAFNNGNVIVEIGKREAIIASVWLNYPIDYWGEIDKGNKIDVDSWIKAQGGNKKTMEGIIASLRPFLSESNKYSIIIGGDFNSGSHLDWVESVKEKNSGYVMPFPTGKYLESLGFKDTYRVIYPDPKKDRGITWTPINPTTHQDRIDYIFIKGDRIKTLDSKVINSHSVRYPSDHAAVLSTLKIAN